MVSFPNCKINLGLHVTRKREDGFHDLETLFYPLHFTDALEIVRGPDNQVIPDQTGLPVAGDPMHNLCVKAWKLLKADFPDLPGIHLHLHKAIPMGAGLGGGSANGAFALKMINQVFHLGLDNEKLAGYALQLGSDCPFFIYNKPCLATGRGEVMKEIELDLANYRFALVHPSIHISTAEAFAGITPHQPADSLTQIIAQPVREWKNTLVNDFEPAAIRHHPAIGEIKKGLYAEGALYASMTGSGSSIYGIFEKEFVLPKQVAGYSIQAVD